MRLVPPHFLRILVAMLVAVFVMNTVYAGSMMASASGQPAMDRAVQNHIMTEDAMAHHCHDQVSDGQPDAAHASAFHAKFHGGSHCHHCMACYSAIVSSQVTETAVRGQPVLAVAPSVLYLAPVNPQPSKPPII